jgi:hypothetical protein
MALTKNQNCYVTVAEADSYFENRIDVAAWTSASNVQKSQALITATSLLDELKWVGYASVDGQPLAFPRFGSYYDPKTGKDVTLGNTVPERIIKATYELAYHLLNNDGLLDDTGTVTDLSVGQISLNIKSLPNKIPGFVRNLVRPLLEGGGRSIWWRAN